MPALINMPRAAWKRQPYGPVAINPQWYDRVLMLARGGDFINLKTAQQQASINYTTGVYHNQKCDTKNGSGSSYITENIGGGLNYMFLTVIVFSSLSGIKQILAYDNSNSGFRFFQFRTNGSNLEFITFTSSNVVQSVSLSGAVENTVMTVCAYASQAQGTFGITHSKNNTIATQSGSFKEWLPSIHCNWFARRNGIAYVEEGDHRTAMRAILRDPGSAAARLDLVRNPWQLFAPAPSRFYLIPTAPVLTIPTLSNPGVTDITATAARPQVTLTY